MSTTYVASNPNQSRLTTPPKSRGARGQDHQQRRLGRHEDARESTYPAETDRQFSFLLSRFARYESITSKSAEDIKDVTDTVLDLGEDFKSISRELRGMVDSVKELQVALSKSGKHSAAVILHKHVDDARFCVADGFMTIFPKQISRKLILNHYDRSLKTVDWSKFKSSLWNHLESHLKLNEGVHEQCESLFRDCSRDLLLFVGKVGRDAAPQRSDSTPNDIPNITFFKRHSVEDVVRRTLSDSELSYEIFEEDLSETIMFDGVGLDDIMNMDVGSDEEADAAVTRLAEVADAAVIGEVERMSEIPHDLPQNIRFYAYAPVFIWAYNTLKKSILRDEAKIWGLEGKVLDQRNALRALRSQSPLPAMSELSPIESAFGLGTAVACRAKGPWDSISGQVDSAPSDKEKKDAIGKGDAQSTHRGSPKGFSSSEIASSSDVAAVPALHNVKVNVPSSRTHLSSKNVLILAQSTEKEIRILEAKIALAKKRRERRLEKFNAVSKCLAVLLDPKLLDFVVHGKSFVRFVSEFMENDVKDVPMTADALERVQRFVDEYSDDRAAHRESQQKRDEETEEPCVVDDTTNKRKRGPVVSGSNDGVLQFRMHPMLRGRVKESKIRSGHLDVVDDMKRLMGIIYERSGFFDDQDEVFVEKAIDEHLKLATVGDRSPSLVGGYSDYEILLVWLCKTFPNAGH